MADVISVSSGSEPELITVSSGSNEPISEKMKAVLAAQRAIPEWPHFKGLKQLKTKFSVQENYARGNCMFESVRDAMTPPDAPNARHNASLPRIFRSDVCEFYKHLYGVKQDNEAEFNINEAFLIEQIRAADRDISQEDLEDILYSKKIKFADKEEMVDSNGANHFTAICKNYIYASTLDVFILSLLLNMDIYTYVNNRAHGIALTDACFRKAPVDALFLLHTPDHYEALIPKGNHALAFKHIPPNLPSDARRLYQMWPELWDPSITHRDSHSPMAHYHLSSHDSNSPGYKRLNENRKSKKNPKPKSTNTARRKARA
jgi:hypothetical protein